jgi:diaminohydroxyphosphoribosylaminopyrimidine deaminase/5-amino-6-(5-phosphoribosylamino)uracil reductase
VKTLDERMMLRAALAGWRGMGRVEPNPMVGCVIGNVRGEVLGVGWHRVFGGAHAEVEALRDCERRGHSAHGATAWVTLEPCNHFGKTPPCVDALLRAGVARVVFARRDPNPPASGGAARLAAAGVEIVELEGCELATRLSEPFVKRTSTGLPWVVAKWAQTLDGKVATRTGDSKWISNEFSRAMVHRLRGRVDAVLTGIGTVRGDDPRLTARGLGAVRRVARRCVVDPRLEIPDSTTMLRGVGDAPVTLFCSVDAAASGRAGSLRGIGCEVVGLPEDGRGSLDVAAALRHLVGVHQAANVMIESGPRLLGRMIGAGLVDEALVFVAPKLLGDPAGLSAVAVGEVPRIEDGVKMRLVRVRQAAGDVVMVMRISNPL